MLYTFMPQFGISTLPFIIMSLENINFRQLVTDLNRHYHTFDENFQLAGSGEVSFILFGVTGAGKVGQNMERVDFERAHFLNSRALFHSLQRLLALSTRRPHLHNSKPSWTKMPRQVSALLKS